MGSLARDWHDEHIDCLVVDDDPGICDLVSAVLDKIGVRSRGLRGVTELAAAISEVRPAVVLLDVELGRSDAVDAIRVLRQARFGGAVQLVSGRDATLVGYVRAIGERHGLQMLPPIYKPFSAAQIRRLFARGAPDHVPPSPEPSLLPAVPHVDLAEALARHWLDVAYQPKIDLAHDRIVGAEGLARLNHPEHGELAPASFLPRADAAALAGLAAFVVQKAMLDWDVLYRAGGNLPFAVNVPVSTLADSAIVELVQQSRPRRPEWPGLILEVTESEAMAAFDLVCESAVQLQMYGIHLSIDDFGAGYSSFARLRQLPFRELKLDRSYVRNCGADPFNGALCRSIVDLAHASGAIAVAEGVETEEERLALRRMGCDLGQGFLFARPLSVGNLIRMVVGESRTERNTALARAARA